MSQAHTSPDALESPGTLDIAGLEAVYDQLATAIDAAGPQQSELFMVKLALLAAARVGSGQPLSGLEWAGEPVLQASGNDSGRPAVAWPDVANIGHSTPMARPHG